MIILLIFILIYIISVFLHWLHIHFAHSKGGILYNHAITNEDWTFMLIPILNTLFGIAMWICMWPIKFSNNNFFKINK